MSIFGPSDTRNYKKLAKEIYDIETRYAQTFCELYGLIVHKSKFAVIDASRPAAALIFLYGIVLTKQVLQDKHYDNELSIMISIFAKVRKKNEEILRQVLDGDPNGWRKMALEETNNMLYGQKMAQIMAKSPSGNAPFRHYFDEVEAVVDKWSRDEF